MSKHQTDSTLIRSEGPTESEMPVQLLNQIDSVPASTGNLEVEPPKVNLQSIEELFRLEKMRDSLIMKKELVAKNLIKKVVNDSILIENAKKEGVPYLLSNEIKDFNSYKNILQVIPKNEPDSIILNIEKYFPLYGQANDVGGQSSYQTYVEEPDKYLKTHKSIKIKSFNDWLILVITFSFVLAGWSKLFINKYFNQILRVVYNYRLAISLFNDKNTFLKRVNILLNSVFAINLGVFLLQLINFYSSNPLNIGRFYYLLIFMVIIPLVFQVKSVTSILTGQLFQAGEYAREYIFNVYLLNKNLGIYLFPIIITIPYINNEVVPYLINLGFAVIAGFYILRLIRVLQIFFQKEVSIFYLFLYLCTLELIPLVWIVKIIITFL